MYFTQILIFYCTLLSVTSRWWPAADASCDCSFSQGDNNGHLLVLLGSAAETAAIGTEVIDRLRQVKVSPATAEVVLRTSPRPDCPSSLAQRDEHTYFSVARDADSGALTISVARPLTQLVRPHDISACSYQASMQLMCGTQCDSGIQFMVTIYDVNDHAPQFDHPSYTFEIPESTSVGLTPFHVTATDADRIGSPNSEIHIELLQGGDGQQIFRLVNGASCNKTFMCEAQLELLQAVDFERGPKVYHLQAVATDRGSPPLSTSVPVTIKILDVDDEDPVFEAQSTNQHYRVRLEEESDPATVHFGPGDIKPAAIHAHDQDTDVNERLLYSVEPNSYFDIDPDTGQIHMKVSIDRDIIPYAGPTAIEGPYMLYATEIFEPIHTAAAMIEIDVIDINDNAPIFPTPRFFNTSIKENNALGAYTGITLKADDIDATPFNIVLYEVLESPTGSSSNLFQLVSISPDTLFRVDSDGVSGRLLCSASLDFEQQREHHFRVRAVDREPYHPKFAARLTNLSDSFAYIVVTVEDVNDCAPEFSNVPVSFEIPEDMHVGTPIGIIEAHDNDTVGIDTYDLKDTPGGTNGLTSSSSRSSTTGSGTVDRQSGVGVDFFSIHPLRAQLFLSTSLINTFLGFEKKQFFLDVTANDSVNAVATKSITITVYDVNNNAPVFTHAYYGRINVSELTPAGTVVGRVSATDLDSGLFGTVEYSLAYSTTEDVSPPPVPLAFAIDAQNGTIFLRDSIVYSNTIYHNYPLVVTARDNPGSATNFNTAQATVEFIIINENINPPVIANVSRFQVEETATRNTLIGRLNATDIDGDALEYGWVRNTPQTAAVALDPLSGELFVADPAGIDYEKIQQLEMLAFVRDTSHKPRAHTVTTTVIVDIINMNDNPPIFTRPVYRFDWLETAPTLNASVLATDADLPPWNVITYSISLDYVINRATFPFTINATSGEIALKWPLPPDVIVFERQPTFSFPVYATDNGGLKDRAFVEINLINANNHVPVFEQPIYRAQVLESATVGTMLLRVKAHTTNFNPDLQYDIVPSTDNDVESANAFMIVPGTDVVIVMRELERAKRAQYNLTVRARDAAASTAASNAFFGNATLLIKILDVNDNPPVFEHALYEFAIEEERRYVNFGRVNATDKDEGKNAEFDFKIVDNVAQTFGHGLTANGSSSGNIKRITRLQKRAAPNCDFNDPDCFADLLNTNPWGYATASTTTTTNAPPLIPREPTIPTTYYDTIALDPEPATTIPVPFDVNSLTGYLSTRGRIDRDAEPIQEFHKFLVIATDHGDKPLTGTTTVLVRIIDINDNPPEIVGPSTTFPLTVDEGSVVHLQVNATDRDSGVNAELRYALRPSADFANFSVDLLSGLVQSRTPLWILNGKTEFIFDVDVFNPVPVVNLAPNQSPNATLHVVVSLHDINNNAPIFDQHAYDAVLSENDALELFVRHAASLAAADDAGAGSSSAGVVAAAGAASAGKVLVVHATDADILPENKMLQYSLLAPAPPAPSPSASSHYKKLFTIFSENNSKTGNGNGIVSIAANVTPFLTDILTTFTLEARVTDNGIGHVPDRANITINVLDSNNHAPECKFRNASGSSSLFVGETAPLGMLVLYGQQQQQTPDDFITCTDADFGDNALLHYVLEFDSLASRFNRTPADGGPPQAFRVPNDRRPQLELVRHLDYEDGDKVFKFALRVMDSGEPVQQTLVPFEIHILNENTHPPVFPRELFNFSINEDAPLSAAVGNASATDRDGDTLSYQLFYSPTNIGGGDRSSRSSFSLPFNVSLHDGIVAVARKLDLKRPVHDYDFNITADDGVHQTHAAIHVNVLQVNEFPPEFSQLVFDTEMDEFDDEEELLSHRHQHRHKRGTDVGDIENDGDDENDNKVVDLALSLQRQRLAQPVTLVKATDRDFGIFGQVYYEIVGSSSATNFDTTQTTAAALPFMFNKSREGGALDNGELMVRANMLSLLQYRNPALHPAATAAAAQNNNNEFLFYVKGIDGGGLSSQTALRIRVRDVNNKWPKFERARYSLKILEESQPHCMQNEEIIATDEDTIGTLSYSVKNASLAQKFRIDEQQHRLCSRVVLDREEIPSYDVVISVFDGIHTSHALAHVKVIDINDHSPVFLPHASPGSGITKDRTGGSSPEPQAVTYRINIPEDIEAGAVIINMGATDADEGANAQIDYFLRGDRHATELFFDIDSTTGDVQVLQPLTNQTGRHVLRIMARDRGNPPLNTSATLFVFVNATNQHSPHFDRFIYRAKLKENAPQGQTVVRLDAPDEDEFEAGNVFFNILSARPDNASFTLIKQSRSSAVLRVERPTLDYERPEERFYELVVEARDNAYVPRRTTAIVQIELEDENDNAPVLALMPELPVRYLARNLHVGSVLYRFYGFDADSGLNGQVHILLLSSSHPQMISLNTTTNDLVLISEPRAIVMQIQVVAFDLLDPTHYGPAAAARQSSAKTLVVKIVEEVDAYPLFKPTPVSHDPIEVDEELSEPGTRLATLQAVTGDGADVVYQLAASDDSEEAKFFGVEPRSGALFLLSPLHKPSRPVYHLPILAVNAQSPTAVSEAVAIVHIRRFHDECPYFPLSVYAADVPETTSTGALVMTLNAVQPDRAATPSSPNRRVQFSVDLASRAGLFRIQTVNSSIATVGDGEEDDLAFKFHQQLQTQVVVNGPLDAHFTQTNNDDSMALATATASYRAALLRRQRRSTTPSSDFDSGGATNYEPTDVIHSLIVSIHDLIDNPKENNKNRKKCTDSTLVLLRVLKQNIGIPKFECTQYEGSVPENSLPQTPICIRGLKCTSGVNTNTNRTEKPTSLLYRPKRSTEALTPKFSPLPLTTDIDQNNKCPATLSSACGRLSAHDSDDTDDTLRYIISEEDGSSGFFYLDSRTGAMQVNRLGLDRETVPAYHLQVSALDPTGNVGNASLIVVLEDVDDNAPVFSPTSANLTVQENKKLPHDQPQRLFLLNATDADIGENARIIYLIIPDADDAGSVVASRFGVDQSTGWVLATKPLDRDWLIFHQAARDMGNGMALVTLTILATNPARSRELSESLPSQIFRLNIYINDTNDSPPTFDKSEYYVEVASNAPVPLRVIQLDAHDPDFNQPPLRYRILGPAGGANTASSAATAAFSIVDPTNGIIMLIEKFTHHYDDDALFKNDIVLAVEVTDSVFRTQTRVRVHLVRANRPPRFLDREYHMSVAERMPNSTRVGVVTAIDADVEDASQLTYSLLRSFDDDSTTSASSSPLQLAFQIHPKTGEISTNTVLNWKKNSHYLLLAQVTDRRAHGDKHGNADADDDDYGTDTARIFVTVLDVNEPPVFDPRLYEFSADEGYYLGPSGGLLAGKLSVHDPDEGENGRIVRFVVTQMSQQEGAAYFETTSDRSGRNLLLEGRNNSDAITTALRYNSIVEEEDEDSETSLKKKFARLDDRASTTTTSTTTTTTKRPTTTSTTARTTTTSSTTTTTTARPTTSTTSTTTARATTTTSTTTAPSTSPTTTTTKPSSTTAAMTTTTATKLNSQLPLLKAADSHSQPMMILPAPNLARTKSLPESTKPAAAAAAQSAESLKNSTGNFNASEPVHYSTTTSVPTTSTTTSTTTTKAVTSSTTPISITSNVTAAVAAHAAISTTTAGSATSTSSTTTTTTTTTAPVRSSTPHNAEKVTHAPALHIRKLTPPSRPLPHHHRGGADEDDEAISFLPPRRPATTPSSSSGEDRSAAHRLELAAQRMSTTVAVTRRPSVAFHTTTISVPRWTPVRRPVPGSSSQERPPLPHRTPFTAMTPPRNFVERGHRLASSVFDFSTSTTNHPLDESEQQTRPTTAAPPAPTTQTTPVTSLYLPSQRRIDQLNGFDFVATRREDGRTPRLMSPAPADTTTQAAPWNIETTTTSGTTPTPSTSGDGGSIQLVEDANTNRFSLLSPPGDSLQSRNDRKLLLDFFNKPTEENLFNSNHARYRRETAAAGAAAASFQLSVPKPATNELRLFGDADYEAYWNSDYNNFDSINETNTYYFNVTAVDGGRPPLSAVAFIKLTLRDVNDNAPQFVGLTSSPSSATEINASERAHAGEELLRFYAYDRDSGANGRVLLDFGHSSVWTPLIKKYFYLQTVSVERPFANNSMQTLPAEMLPVIRHAQSYARTTLRTSQRLLTFFTAAQAFARKHSLTLPSVLQQQQQSVLLLSLPVSIVARDMGSPVSLSTEYEIVINLRQAADRPEFDRLVSHISLHDTTPVGSVVYAPNFKVSALPSSTTFSLLNDGENNSTLFAVDKKSGIVTLAAPLKNRALSTRHFLTLQATAETTTSAATQCTATSALFTPTNNNTICSDEDEPLSDTTLLIVNIERNREFAQKEYDLKVAENDATFLKQPIYDFDTVSELDQTKPGSSVVTYTLYGATASLFLLESKTGRLFLRNLPLDREQYALHTLFIQVQNSDDQNNAGQQQVRQRQTADMQDELLYNEAKIIIHVLDRNDNKPQFVENSPMTLGVMRQAAAATWIGRVEATDADTAEFGNIRYRLATPTPNTNATNAIGLVSPDDLVYVDAVTGDLFTAMSLPQHVKARSPAILIHLQAVDDSGHGLVSDTLTLRLFALERSQVAKIVCRLSAEENVASNFSRNVLQNLTTLLAAPQSALTARISFLTTQQRSARPAPVLELFALSTLPHTTTTNVLRSKSDIRIFGIQPHDSTDDGDETAMDAAALIKQLVPLLPKLQHQYNDANQKLPVIESVLPLDSADTNGDAGDTGLLLGGIGVGVGASPTELALLILAIILIGICFAGFAIGCYVITSRRRRRNAEATTALLAAGAACRPAAAEATNKWSAKNQLLQQRPPIHCITSSSDGVDKTYKNTKPATVDSSGTTTAVTASTSSPTSSMVGSALSMLNKTATAAAPAGASVKTSAALPPPPPPPPPARPQSFLDRIFGGNAKDGSVTPATVGGVASNPGGGPFRGRGGGGGGNSTTTNSAADTNSSSPDDSNSDEKNSPQMMNNRRRNAAFFLGGGNQAAAFRNSTPVSRDDNKNNKLPQLPARNNSSGGGQNVSANPGGPALRYNAGRMFGDALGSTSSEQQQPAASSASRPKRAVAAEGGDNFLLGPSAASMHTVLSSPSPAGDVVNVVNSRKMILPNNQPSSSSSMRHAVIDNPAYTTSSSSTHSTPTQQQLMHESGSGGMNSASPPLPEQMMTANQRYGIFRPLTPMLELSVEGSQASVDAVLQHNTNANAAAHDGGGRSSSGAGGGGGGGDAQTERTYYFPALTHTANNNNTRSHL